MDQIETEFNMALNKAAALCSGSEKCSVDILKKLEQWQVDPVIANQVIQNLIQERFIDHQRFATFFVKDKFRFNKWGKRKIAFELSRKNIEKDIINEALMTIDDEEYLDSLTEILKVKLRQIKNKDQWQTKNTLIRYGTSKGFEMEVILKTIQSNLNLKDEEE